MTRSEEVTTDCILNCSGQSEFLLVENQEGITLFDREFKRSLTLETDAQFAVSHDGLFIKTEEGLSQYSYGDGKWSEKKLPSTSCALSGELLYPTISFAQETQGEDDSCWEGEDDPYLYLLNNIKSAQSLLVLHASEPITCYCFTLIGDYFLQLVKHDGKYKFLGSKIGEGTKEIAIPINAPSDELYFALHDDCLLLQEGDRFSLFQFTESS